VSIQKVHGGLYNLVTVEHTLADQELDCTQVEYQREVNKVPIGRKPIHQKAQHLRRTLLYGEIQDGLAFLRVEVPYSGLVGVTQVLRDVELVGFTRVV
jgi:hypothetical protein